jgi:hypothetical protein
MEMPESKQQQPTADVCEATLWYLRSKAKHLPKAEVHEFARWLRRSPENASALLQIAAIERSAGPFDRAAPLGIPERRALSLIYYKHVKRQYLYPKFGLLTIALGSVAAWMFLQDPRPLKIALVAVACFVLMLVRERVLRYRVKHGYFGGTESEVRDFVKFIAAYRGDIDFTDQGGKRRPSLVPEPSDRASSAASAPSGVVPK